MADALAGARERTGVGHIGGGVAQQAGELIPIGSRSLRAATIADTIAELLVGHLVAGDADDVDMAGQSALAVEIEQSRAEFLMGQVAAGAHDDQRGGSVGSRVAEGVGAGGHHCGFASRTAWPPNWLRRAARSRAPKGSSWRERKRW